MTGVMEISVTRTTKSRLASTKLENIPFGSVYTDHMLEARYENGEWTAAEIKPYQPISIQPSMAALHYGQAIFEGIKAYRNEKGEAFIFRPYDNFKRFNQSAERMNMPVVPEEIFMEGMKQLISLDKEWIPAMKDHSLYIRPVMFATDEALGVRPSKSYAFFIILSPTGPYFVNPMRILVEEKYTRAAPGGVGFAKNAGNYGGSMLATTLAQKQGFDQVLWTDAFEHKYVQEIGTMNVFFIVDGVALTPNLDEGTILAGVTRDSIITLLKENGIEVQERPISIDELVEAQKSGKLQEAFGSGTAASMSFISDLTYQGETLYLPEINTWSISPKIKKQLDDIRYGRTPDTHGWIFRI